MDNVSHAMHVLGCVTPQAWFDAACDNVPTLLIDHANCEKKAAGTALSLLYRHVDKPKLLRRMSRLAREELRHFEQVLAMLATLGVTYVHIAPSRYASSMRALIRTSEPGRLLDTLLVGAVVEARSCERFAGLASRLDGRLGNLYQRLLASEARHCEYYLELARDCADGEPFDERLLVFVERDRGLVLSTDAQFRFHSGVPCD